MNGFIKLCAGFALIALISACAPLPQPPLKPLTAPAVNSGGKAAKVDNFQIILDSSLSMEEGGKFFVTGRDIASRINQGVPTDLTYNSGLRTFGHNSHQSNNPTDLVYGMTQHDRQAFHDSIGTVRYIGGTSPLAAALNAAAQDLKAAGGKSAIIVISDGLDMDNAPAAAKQAKDQLGDNLCIYTVAVGTQRNSMGHDVLEKVAEAGQCGSATTAAKLGDAGSMSQFVSTVFLTDPPPAPAPVRAPAPAPAPAPVIGDSDGDGVPDNLDKCPGTPAGVRVDAEGCPTVLSLRVNFGFDSTRVATDFDGELAKAATCISNYPGHEVNIIGHTDSTGPAAYNQGLSERRATAVKNALIERFNVPAAKMVALGMGEEKPVDDNNTEEGRAMNRRVDVACGYDVQ